jgi:hypothetical protein
VRFIIAKCAMHSRRFPLPRPIDEHIAHLTQPE